MGAVTTPVPGAIGRRRGTAAWPLAALVGLLAAPAAAAEPPLRRGPPPAWVEPAAVDLAAPPSAAAARAGWYWALRDVQINAAAAPRQAYVHLARAVENDEGVQAASTIAIEFDPSYQRVAVHALRLHRDGAVLDRLATTPIEVLQRERRLEEDVYEGSRTALAVLSDVRRGDVVEWAYSVTGANPVFGDSLGAHLVLQDFTAVGAARVRVLWPRARPLATRTYAVELAPATRPAGAATEHVWTQRDVAPYRFEPDTPAWHDAGAWLQVSSFQSWGEVARWGAPLYEPVGGAAVARQVAALRAGHADLHAQVREAVRVVQEDVRYFAVALGPGSHRPSPPDVVLERRFGDCKDKSLLLAALLRGLGVEADVAVVASDRGERVAELLPSPLVFDHAIVRARVDGVEYWIDPTLRGQGGDLAGLAVPPYGRALVLRADTTELSQVPEQGAPPRTEIRHVLHAPRDDANVARLRVETTYTGADADEVRRGLLVQSRADLERQSHAYYGAVFPTLEIAAPLDVRDDPAANRLRIVESYRVGDFWTARGPDRRRVAELFALELDGALPRPKPGRAAPLALGHPRHIVQELELHLPRPWPIDMANGEIANQALAFSYATHASGATVRQAFELHTRADHVAAADLPAFARDVDAMRDQLGLTLYDALPGGAPRGIDEVTWPLVLIALLTLAPAAAAAVRFLRRTAPGAPAAGAAAPPGIGGWLVLLGLGVVMTPVALLVQGRELAPMFTASVWYELTVPGREAYHHLYAPLLMYELSANLVLLVGSLVVAVLFFRQQRLFPRVYVGFLLLTIAFMAIDLLVSSRVSPLASRDLQALTRPLLALLIWGTYLNRSSRARQTFVR